MQGLAYGCGVVSWDQNKSNGGSVMKSMMKILTVAVIFALMSRVAYVEAKDIVIAYSQAELVNAWRVTNQKDMEAWAKKLGASLSVSMPTRIRPNNYRTFRICWRRNRMR